MRGSAGSAGGNPLFVTEMIAMAAGAGEGGCAADAFKALLAARLDQLEASERGVLERGAVEGELFHRGAVQALSPADSQVTPRLAALVRKDLIRPDRPLLIAEDGFRFCHLLLRDAAYDALPKTMRAQLHERFADWLDLHGATLVQRDELLGYHLEQAYRYRTELELVDDRTRALGERAAGHLAAAGHRATTRGDHHAAVNLLQRALSLGISDPRKRVQLQVELGNALHETGRISDADAVLDEAGEAATALGEKGVAALALIYLCTSRMGDPQLDLAEVQAICEQAIETFSELGDERGLAIAGRLLGLSLNRQDHLVAGVAELERALAHAEASGDPAVRRRVIGTLLTFVVNGPTPVGEAIDRCEQLLRSTRSDRVLEAVLKRFLGLFYAMAARPDEALELIRESSPVLDELNQLTVSALYRGAAAYAKELAGDRAGAEQELVARLRWFSEAGHRGVDRRAIDAAFELASFYCDERRWEDAERVLSDVRAIRLSGESISTQLALAAEARLAAHRGDLAEAVTLAERAVALADTKDRPDMRARIWLALGEVRRAAGQAAAADTATARAIELYEQKGNLAAAARARAAPHGT